MVRSYIHAVQTYDDQKQEHQSACVDYKWYGTVGKVPAT